MHKALSCDFSHQVLPVLLGGRSYGRAVLWSWCIDDDNDVMIVKIIRAWDEMRCNFYFKYKEFL